mgnify:CR=1 FL=1
MTTEFRDLQELYEKKRKNEQAVSEELLQTRYKKSYDQLCGNVKQKQCELRAAYMERMRVITGLISGFWTGSSMGMAHGSGGRYLSKISGSIDQETADRYPERY